MNDAYGALGEHYMTAIMPTQVRKPKQKASAEGAVKDAAAWAIARLRSRVFAALQLRPLPSVRYDVAQWACDRAVNLDFRVVHAKNRYSVPLQLDPAFAGSFLSLLS